MTPAIGRITGMASVPHEFISADVETVASKCSGFREQVEKFRVTSFHIAFGMIPLGIDISVFSAIRKDFLCGQHASLMDIPLFNILNRYSTAIDIKNHLLALGFDEAKVKGLPDSLTFEQYMNGELKPELSEEDFYMLVSKVSRLSHYKCTIFELYFDDEKSKGKLVQCFEVLYHGMCVQYMSDIRRALMKLPKALSYFLWNQSQFRCRYRNFDSIIIHGLVEDIIKRREEAIENCWIISPMAHLANAKNTGKTRAVFELGSLTNVVYFNAGAESRNNYGCLNGFCGSQFWKDFSCFLQNEVPQRCKSMIHAHVIMHAVLQRILYICSECHSYNEILTGCNGCIMVDDVLDCYYGAQKNYAELFTGFDALGVGNVWRETSCDPKGERNELNGWKIPEWKGMSMAEIEASNKAWLLRRRTLLHEAADQIHYKRVSKLPTVIFAFDEAARLDTTVCGDDAKVTFAFGGQIYNTDIYNILKWTLRHFSFYWNNSFTITISNWAKPKESKREVNTNPSYRPECDAGTVTLDPINLKTNFDIFRGGLIDESYTKDWREYLFSRRRLISIAACGRPVFALIFGPIINREIEWGVNVDKILSQKLLLPLAYTSSMVARGEIRDNGQEFSPWIDEQSLITMFSLALGMKRFQDSISHKDLIGRGGMVLEGFDDTVVVGSFRSEGLLNGAASLLLVNHFDIYLRKFHGMTWKNGKHLFNQDEISDILNKVYLIKAAFKATTQHGEMGARGEYAKHLLKPVSIMDFLAKYAGKRAAEDYLEHTTGLKGSFLAFTHFIYVDIDEFGERPYDSLANYLSRGAAITTQIGSFIPLVLEDGLLSFIYARAQFQHKTTADFKKLKVAMDSPERFLKLPKDGLRPYCYISSNFGAPRPKVNRFDGNKIDCEAIVQDPNSAGIPHQPCLWIEGMTEEVFFEAGANDLPTERDDYWSYRRSRTETKPYKEQELDLGDFETGVAEFPDYSYPCSSSHPNKQ